MILLIPFRTRVYYSILAILFLISCNRERSEGIKTLFYKLPASQTNIEFSNTLKESDDFNIIEYLYFYNGAGVATGDINNDGLSDICFSSNQGSNTLYLNKGNFQFEDITVKAGVAGSGNWKTGISMADVNGDGFLDIFVCGVGSYKNFNGRNQLFINNGDLTFTDKTDQYGLSFTGFSTQASFFDYDKDGDLDMYLLNHSVHSVRSYGDVMLRFQSDPLAGDKLYRNELIPFGAPHFTEVTSAAGIFSSQIGYGLGIGISDLNWDGNPDLYVSNDFHENDYLYINQGNGTFKQELEKSIPHSSRFSMGNDIADINNDGWSDIISLDMLPKDEQVIKTTAGEDPYDIYQFKLRFGYHYQFARNTLQLNRGPESDQHLIFSDIAPLAGIDATDWSWSPLLADFDNDGYKDLFVANGISKRPNDLDYISYISKDSAQRFLKDEQFIERMPSGKVPNFFFRNKHDLTFEDVSAQWIGKEPDLSNGAAYADLDNDGDLDLIVNNINSKASIYRNDLSKTSGNFLKVKLNGEGANKFGVGTKIIAFIGDKKIYHEQSPTRGWQSSVDYIIHIGLGNVDRLDSLSIIWPNGKYQTLRSVKANQTLRVNEKDAPATYSYQAATRIDHPLLSVSKNQIPFVHKENDFNAFNVERLTPHMVSTQGPKISVGDVNKDGLNDLFIGGATGQAGTVVIQDRSGNFIETKQQALAKDSLTEDIGSALFDADGNGTLDLIVVSGGQQYSGNDKNLQPRLYLNNGKGGFAKANSNLPEIIVNASCVKPADVDGDGDSDLFIGGRVVSGKYGVDPKSFILINNDKGVFTNETSRLIPWPANDPGAIGMVTDAAWHDINKDGRVDLIIVGEWMPITVLVQNTDGIFQDETDRYGLKKTSGWWNTISSGDFDHDGDMDFLTGNTGLNTHLKPTVKEPVSIFIGDIDNNGSLDHILTYFNGGVRYPLASRDQLAKQVPSLKRKFLKYSSYSNAKLDDIIHAESIEKLIVKNAFTFASAYLENAGNDKFIVHDLPSEAQIFPVFSYCAEDINHDGKIDFLAVGNLYAVQPELGRYDAGYGLIMLGDGKGNFTPMSARSSGFVVKGEGRDIKSLVTSKGETLYVIARNNDSILVFKKQK